MYSNDPIHYRLAFLDAWEKYKNKLPLTSLESQLADVIIAHPEYHSLLTNRKQLESQTFELHDNPFFHLSLHLAIKDQIKLNRPNGIEAINQALSLKHSAHEAEHIMMHTLALTLQEAQAKQVPPDENVYLIKLNELIHQN